jgi:hypothetical protein
MLPESEPKNWHVFRLLLYQAAHAERGSVSMKAGEPVGMLRGTAVDLGGEAMAILK